jgi:hypothetical protein
MNLPKMAAAFSGMIAVNFMEPVTSHWNVAFAITRDEDWDPSAMLISKKIGRPLPDRHSLKNGSGKLVSYIVHFSNEWNMIVIIHQKKGR